MSPWLTNLLFWLGFVVCIFYIRSRRMPYAIQHFLWLPEEEVLWIDLKIEITIQQGTQTRYQTVDLTLTTQRLLFSQFGYYELIWDFTHPNKPHSVAFNRPYYCISKEHILYEKTFRGKQSLRLIAPTTLAEQYTLDLADSEQNYALLFGPPASTTSMDEFLGGI